MKKFKFGDIIENGWAGYENPTRIGIFVRYRHRTIELTDGKGKFWEVYHLSDNKNKKIGTIYDNLDLLEVK